MKAARRKQVLGPGSRADREGVSRQLAGCQEGGRQEPQPDSRAGQGAAWRWSEVGSCWLPEGRQVLGLDDVLLVEMFVDGCEEQFAGHEEGGWQTVLQYILVLFCQCFVTSLLLTFSPTHLTMHCILHRQSHRHVQQCHVCEKARTLKNTCLFWVPSGRF